jgi:hypothetical protein
VLRHLILDNLVPELASRGVRIGADEALQRELHEAATAALSPQSAEPDRLPARSRPDYAAAIAASAFLGQVRRIGADKL